MVNWGDTEKFRELLKQEISNLTSLDYVVNAMDKGSRSKKGNELIELDQHERYILQNLHLEGETNTYDFVKTRGGHERIELAPKGNIHETFKKTYSDERLDKLYEKHLTRRDIANFCSFGIEENKGREDIYWIKFNDESLESLREYATSTNEPVMTRAVEVIEKEIHLRADLRQINEAITNPHLRINTKRITNDPDYVNRLSSYASVLGEKMGLNSKTVTYLSELSRDLNHQEKNAFNLTPVSED